MFKILKSTGQSVKILKQYRGASNNYKNNDSKVYSDLYKIQTSDGKISIACSTELT